LQNLERLSGRWKMKEKATVGRSTLAGNKVSKVVQNNIITALFLISLLPKYLYKRGNNLSKRYKKCIL
jgi:hypothetical protein